jgi:hypothetical protein
LASPSLGKNILRKAARHAYRGYGHGLQIPKLEQWWALAKGR